MLIIIRVSVCYFLLRSSSDEDMSTSNDVNDDDFTPSTSGRKRKTNGSSSGVSTRGKGVNYSDTDDMFEMRAPPSRRKR